MITKKLVALSALLVASLLTSAVFQKKADAYQFRGISQNTDAGRHAQLLWVYNAASSAAEDGDVVVWNDGSVADGVEVNTTTTFNNKLVAGVVAQESIAAATWGFIQTHGYHDSVTVGSATAAGDMLATSVTAEVGSVFTVADSSVTHSLGVYAIALEATVTSTTVKAFLRI